MSIATANVIDLHAHAVLEETLGIAGEHGPELGTGPDGQAMFRVANYCLHGVRYRGSAFMDPEVRIAAMDREGIDFQVLSPNPLTYFHFIDDRSGAAFCRRHNDALATMVRRYPGRLAGLAALPMQSPSSAVDELTRAVEQLGLWGASVGTEFGTALDAPALDPLYERLVALNVPLFLHPAPMGIDGPAAVPATHRYDLDILVGFAAQETIAAATLIFGGVLDRHPELDICISHGGGAIALLCERFSLAAQKRPWSTGARREPGAFKRQLRRLWFDNHLHGEAALRLLEDTVGREHMVLGTNFAGWDQASAAKSSPPPVWLADNARQLLRR